MKGERWMLGITFKLNHTTSMNKTKSSKAFHDNRDSNWLAEHLTCFFPADLKCTAM